MSGFLSNLIPAVWRGVPFHALGDELRFGRRPAVHEYPYANAVWVEDLGRATRVIRLRGRLVGDDVYAQRALFAAACELPGPGLLIHPTLGAVTVSLAEPAVLTTTWERGRVVEFDLAFIQGGQQLFPSLLLNTQNAVLIAAAAAVLAVAAEVSSLASAVPVQSAAVQTAATIAATSWVALATSAGTDAALIADETAGLPGNFGRFIGSNAVAGSSATISTIQAAVVLARVTLAVATEGLIAAAPGLFSASATACAAAQAVAEALRTVALAPADQIRLLNSLAAFEPASMASAAPIGGSIAQTTSIVGALCRRSALIAMAEAGQSYQPTSYDDALAVLQQLVDALDAEITVAGDAGDDQSYLALNALRAAVVDDLTARGASLAPLATFSFPAPLPSLTLANRLYQDPTREPQLVAAVDPIHPLFMPPSFTALSY